MTDTMFCYHCAALTRHARRKLPGGRVAYACCTCQHGETLPGFERFKP